MCRSRQKIAHSHSGPVGPLQKQDIARLDFVLHRVTTRWHAMRRPGISAKRTIQFTGVDQDIYSTVRRRPAHLRQQSLPEMIGRNHDGPPSVAQNGNVPCCAQLIPIATGQNEISGFLNRRTRLNLLGQHYASFRFENGNCFWNYRDRPSFGDESLFHHRMNQTGYGNPAQHHFLDDARKLRAPARPRLDNVICLEYLHKMPSVCCRLAVGRKLASNH
jgi:hypothetical protein